MSGGETVEGQKDSTAWKDGLETTHLEGVHLGNSGMQIGSISYSVPVSDGVKVWGEDGWLES